MRTPQRSPKRRKLTTTTTTTTILFCQIKKNLSTDSLPNFSKMCLKDKQTVSKKKKKQKKFSFEKSNLARKPWAGAKGLHSPSPPSSPLRWKVNWSKICFIRYDIIFFLPWKRTFVKYSSQASTDTCLG